MPKPSPTAIKCPLCGCYWYTNQVIGGVGDITDYHQLTCLSCGNAYYLREGGVCSIAIDSKKDLLEMLKVEEM